MYFDRFDVCEAYCLYAHDYNMGGWASGRKQASPYDDPPSDIGIRLRRMGFKLSSLFKRYESLTDNGKAIYDALEQRRG